MPDYCLHQLAARSANLSVTEISPTFRNYFTMLISYQNNSWRLKTAFVRFKNGNFIGSSQEQVNAQLTDVLLGETMDGTTHREGRVVFKRATSYEKFPTAGFSLFHMRAFQKIHGKCKQ